jgi:hypothetical protein
MHDFTPDPSIDLSTWDFFMALKEGVESYAARAKSGRVQVTMAAPGEETYGIKSTIRSDQLIICGSGQLCPKAGVWAVADDLRARRIMKKDERFPQNNGAEVSWVFVEV